MNDLENGKVITKKFTIAKINAKEKSIDIVLVDENNEQISGILKDNISIFNSSYSVGDKILCKSRVRKLRKNFCLEIIWITKVDLENHVEKFSSNDYEEKFLHIIESIDDTDYKSVLTNCFNEDVLDLFFSYPATKNDHHSYMSGLLKHSVDVVEISLSLCNFYPSIDKNLICSAGLLHDIGCLKSFDIDDDSHSVTVTEWDSLLGHAAMSALFISKVITQDIEQSKALALYNLVLNHHSDVYKTKENFILKKADEISIFMR